MKVLIVSLAMTCLCIRLAEAAPKTFQGPDVTFTYDDALLKSPKAHRVKALPLAFPTDVPEGVAPAHVVIEFGKESGGIEIYPTSDPAVKDFARAYPPNAAAAKELRRVLRERPLSAKDLPTLPWADVDMPFHKKIRYFNFRNGSGVVWLTQRAVDTAPINNAQLWYVFQGLTSDGAYYVAAQIRVTHPSLPSTAVVKDYRDFEKQYPTYLPKAANALAAKPDETFQPPLAALRAMLASIEVKTSR